MHQNKTTPADITFIPPAKDVFTGEPAPWPKQERAAESKPGPVFIVALRNLTRRETVKCNAYQGYTKDFHVLQYQTNDGVWHDLPSAFEEIA